MFVQGNAITCIDKEGAIKEGLQRISPFKTSIVKIYSELPTILRVFLSKFAGRFLWNMRNSYPNMC